VHFSRIRTGLAVGAIAAAATAGALAGFGVRQGTPARPFNVLASILAGDRAAGTWGFDPVATPLGAALHGIIVVAYGLAFVVLAGERSGRSLWIWGTVFAGSLYLAGFLLAPLLFGGVATTVLQPVQLLALHVVLAVALVMGMRFALYNRRR
jgi:hypothetical protein